MDDFNQEEYGDKKKLKRVEKFVTDKEFSMYEEVSDIAESLKILASKEDHKMEMPEVHKIKIEGVEVITLKGEKGDKGETGEKGESIVGPQGKKGEKGEKGERGEMGLQGIQGERGVDGINGIDGKDGSPDTPYQVRDKLESIDNESEKLKIEAIQNLREELDKIEKNIKLISGRPIGGGGFSVGAMNFHLIDDESIAGTKDGVNTAFTIANVPSPASSLKIYRNGARQRVTEDYTVSGASITFIIPPESTDILLADYRT